MDDGFIFPYSGSFVITWGMTRLDNLSVRMIGRLSRETVPIGKSVGATLSGDGDPDVTSGNLSDFSFREKCRKEKLADPSLVD